MERRTGRSPAFVRTQQSRRQFTQRDNSLTEKSEHQAEANKLYIRIANTMQVKTT
jgi:hypothetical protein